MPPKLTRVFRLDAMPITKAEYTEEGYLVDKPILTRCGIFEYTNPDGSIRRELRLPEEVFDPESLASYKAKPIVVTHDAGLITKDNVGENQIGTIMSEGIKDGDAVRAEITIFDTDEMKRSGYKELSLGYNLDLDETPGVYKGQKYDAVQRAIRINHLALVENARAGEKARLNIDSRDKKSSKGEKIMAKKKISHGDGLLTPDELKKAIAEYRKNHPKTDAEEEKTEETVVTSKPVEGPAAPAAPVAPAVQKTVETEKKVEEDEEEEEEKLPIEEKANEIKARHEDDEDVQMLCDIIDTLLAQKDFDAADEPVEEKKKEDPFATDGEDDENCDGDDEEKKEDPFATDGDPDELEELKGDEDEEEDPSAKDEDDKFLEEEDPFAEDEDEETEEEEENLDCGDSPIPSFANTGKKLNADSIDRIVRERIKIGMIGRKINLDGLENMSAMKAKKAIIKKMRPSIRLDGKSSAYINATYDCCVDDINRNTRKGTSAQRKQMFNKDSADMRRVDKNSAEAARERMIARAGKKSN